MMVQEIDNDTINIITIIISILTAIVVYFINDDNWYDGKNKRKSKIL